MPSPNASPPAVAPHAVASPAVPALEDYLSRDGAATYLGVSRSYLAGLACRGGGPAFIKLGSRLVKYRRSDLDAWAAARVRQSTSAATVAASRGEAA